MYYFFIIFLANFIFCNSWTIDTSYSFINYEGSHPFHTWNGKTNDIDFNINCEKEECQMSVSTKLESFDSNNDSRDSNMLYYTESLLFPFVDIKTEYFKFNGQFNQTISTIGKLTFHGISIDIPLNIKLIKENEDHWGECNFDIKLTEFNVERPVLLMMKISDTIKISTKLKLIRNE